MRVLITGSRGFIGRHLHHALAEHQPTCIDIADPHQPRDCRDYFRTERWYFDLVFHCAALVDGRESIEGNAALLAAYNLQLDGALFQWALKTRPGRVVYFSSSAAYPAKFQNGAYARGGLRMKEGFVNDHLVGPPDESYGLVKWVGEQVAGRVRDAGVPVTVVRPFSGYGEDQGTEYPFPAMVERARRGDDPFVVWGDGRQTRDWVHVADVVDALAALVENQVDGPVNLGTGVGTSMDDLARLCMREAGYEAPILHLTDRPSGVQYRVSDNSELLKWFTPRIDLVEGVRRAIAA